MFSQATSQHLLEDRLALLRGESAFVMKFEGVGERVIGKVKKGFNWSQRHVTFDSTSKVTYYVATPHIASSTH